jgi:hypothetical protein
MFYSCFVARSRSLVCDYNHTATAVTYLQKFEDEVTSILGYQDTTEHLPGSFFWPEDSISIEKEACSKAAFAWEQITSRS